MALGAPRPALADPPPPGAAVAESSAPTAANPLVRVSTVSGTVRVIAWNRSEVKVSGDSNLSVSTDRTRAQVHGHSVNLEVHVPAGSQVEVHTVAGGVTVSDVSGSVRARSVDGDVKVTGAPSEVDAESVSGGVEVTVGSSEVRASSVSGRVLVQCAGGGRVSSRTVSGSSKVTGGAFTRVEMRSVSGALEFDGQLGKDANFEFHSHSGDVTLTVPKGTAANVEVRHGRMRVDAATDAGARAGGPSIVVSTFSGEIAVKER
jgi:DUF4097 and DUF4098 domain-containing protein YvlB